jgi:hypothetical protein
MSSRPFVVALLLALVAACEHPTAPDVQAAAEKTELKLVSGDYMQIESGLVELFELASYYGMTSETPARQLTPTASSLVVRDAREAVYHSTVVERVYVPPEGSGGKPVTRFSLIGWSEASNDQHSRRLVVMVGGDTVSPVIIPRGDSTVGSRGRSAVIVTADQADRRVWYGTEGVLRIRVGARTADCPYKDADVGRSGMVDLQDSTKRPMCETRNYEASMAAFIERGDPMRRTLADAVRPRRETIRLVEGTIPGVRLVARCTGTFEKDPYPCFDHWSFWRDNDQFAPDLHVDLSAMKREGDEMVQVIDSGTGPDLREVRGGIDPPYSYRAWSAAGTLIREEARASIFSGASTNPPDGVREIAFQRKWREGARYRIVGNARKLGDRNASPYAMGVVEIAFLPLKPGGTVIPSDARDLHP